MDELAALLEPLDRGEPASEETLRALIEHVERTYATPLPEDYVAFLRAANGADGNLPGGHPVVLWEAEALVEIHEDF